MIGLLPVYHPFLSGVDGQVEKLKNKKDKTEKDQVMLQKMENELEIATQVLSVVTGY
jgi:hypothetical protein